MSWRIELGDVGEVLSRLPDGSVQTAVTSPPYWNMRDYGTGTWSGGDPACDHVEVSRGIGVTNTLGPKRKSMPDSNKLNWGRVRQYGGVCQKCGAERTDQQVGLEGTPQEYVERLVDAFRELRRVLRDDGTFWLNIGDGYVNSNAATDGNGDLAMRHKNLVGIPWRVAFAMQADGWYLRSDIIWAKPSPIPESVTDRPTKSHEYVFLFAKSERYFYDPEAIREEVKVEAGLLLRPPRNRFTGGYSLNANERFYQAACGANRRTVWTLARSPYPEAHHATFPEELPEMCIKAGTSEAGACAKCMTPLERQVKDTEGEDGTLYRGTIGWAKRCDCDTTETRPCVVLDPFAGACTTGLVADRLGRDFLGIELNPQFLEMGRQRLTKVMPLFSEEVAEPVAVSAPTSNAVAVRLFE